MKAVILAAGRGTRLEPLTTHIPKCLVEVGGVTLLDRMVARLTEAGIERIVVVTGHGHDAVERHLAAAGDPRVRAAQTVFNDRYSDWGNYYSLLVAEEAVSGDDFIALDGDVLLGAGVLERLLAATGDLVLAVDRSVELGDEEMKACLDESGRVRALNKRMEPSEACGEFIGVERINTGAAGRVFDELRRMTRDGETHEYYERAFERLAGDIAIEAADVSGCVWCEIDDARDLERATGIVERGDA